MFAAYVLMIIDGQDMQETESARSCRRNFRRRRAQGSRGRVARRAWLCPVDLAHPTTRLYDIANALWYWAPLRDPRDRAPAFADADIPHRVAVFADAYGMTARHRAELAPFAVDMARRYHEGSRASAELDPVFRKLWEDGAKVYLPRAEAWVREAAPAITARLGQPG